MEEEFKGTLKFYDDKITVLYPSNFDKFKVKLGEMLGLTDDFLNNIRLSYKDEDGDKVEIKVEEDYKLFIEEIKKNKQLIELLVEVKEDSNLLIKKCSSSIINYVSKNSSGNINKLSEQIKEKHNSLELSDEIDLNSIPKEVKEKENKNENINNIPKEEKEKENKNENINSIPKEEKEKENKNENIKQEEKSNNNNNNMDNKNDININNNIDNKNNTNDKNKINNIDNADNIEKEKNNQKKVELNNNINNNNQNNNDNQKKENNNLNNNNINNINNQNPQNSQNKNIQQPNKNIQQPQIQNQKQSQIKNDSYLYAFSFPYSCKSCKKGPIYHAMYFCNFCKYIICPDCELKEGPSHKHPFYKVQNADQFETLNLGGEGASELDKFMEGFNNFFGIFGGNNNMYNNQNKNNVQKKNKPQRISLVQLARTNYDLRNVTDQQIEEALIKSKGNVDEAVVSLFGQ